MAEVVVIRWPEERDTAARLAAQGAAILYLVKADDDPPIPTGCLEDWVRDPADDRDLRGRLDALELRAALHHAPPFVDGADRLHHGGRILALNPAEARIAAALTARFGAVVSDQALLNAVSDEATTSSPPLRVEVSRLRSRIRELHLVIHRAQGGYVLLVSESAKSGRS